MSRPEHTQIPDNTPVIIGAGQYAEPIVPEHEPPLSPPMQLATLAARNALADAGGDLRPEHIDALAVVRLFSDFAPAWACPFGGSDNPPGSIASRLGASPATRIYSATGGSVPLELLAEQFAAIARGEVRCALVAGAEAIASQRHAQRQQLQPDWDEQHQLPMEDRSKREVTANPQELGSGMFLPAHYYALIENCRAAAQGNSPQQHRMQMARLLASLSAVAADNPLSVRPTAYSAQSLFDSASGDKPLISLPYGKLMVAQDAVNLAAALVLTSAGQARAWNIDPARWIFLQGYAEGADHCLSERQDPGDSAAMEQVFAAALDMAGTGPAQMDLVDIYSCFPCAVETACGHLGYPIDGSRTLTVTGGLPYFGGPGSNYSTHALAEMVKRLRGTGKQALVTANGGILSKHAAAILSDMPREAAGLSRELASNGPLRINRSDIPMRPMCESPDEGKVLSYTVIYRRDKADRAVILGETDAGERFLARSEEPQVTAWMNQHSPVGRQVSLDQLEGRNYFHFNS